MNERRAYDMDPAIAEIYDRVETQLDDVALLRFLIGDVTREVFERHFGDRRGSPYRDDSPRSIFWARKQGKQRY